MGKLKIPVVSISDIIEMKKRAKRDNTQLKIKIEKTGFDMETLKRWKNTSTKTKLDFLDDALKFAAVCRHSKPR